MYAKELRAQEVLKDLVNVAKMVRNIKKRGLPSDDSISVIKSLSIKGEMLNGQKSNA
jgi:hypothetical protein